MKAKDEPSEPPFLRNVGLLMTLRCQVACPHCIVEAGPHRTEEVALADAYEWIAAVAAYRDRYVRALALTGGEPFHNLELLRRISGFAMQQGLMVSAVTNGFWAQTPARAVEVLRSVPGIKAIAVSTDDHHLPFIPIEKVRNAIVAAGECGVRFKVHVCTEDEDSPGHRLLLDSIHRFAGPEAINTVTTVPLGRALRKLGLTRFVTTVSPPIAACAAGHSPLIHPDGRVFACVGPAMTLPNVHPLLLGRLGSESLEAIFDRAEQNPILHAIRIWGPHRLLEILRDRHPGVPQPKSYIRDSVCHACYQLLENEALVACLEELAEDSAFREKVAYARIHYLQEPQGALAMRLGTATAAGQEPEEAIVPPAGSEVAAEPAAGRTSHSNSATGAF